MDIVMSAAVAVVRYFHHLFYFPVVYVVGGYDGAQIYGDCWRLDLRDLSWRKMNTDPQTPVYFHAATITNVRMDEKST